MGYFTHIADQAFKEGDRGETLFFMGGPWSKPLVIESDEQREKTYSKHLWMQRIFLSVLILGQPFLFLAIPGITGKVLWFIIYLTAIVAIQWLVQRVVFRIELNTLKRYPGRFPFRRFCEQTAQRHSIVMLVLGFMICMSFMACSMWMFSAFEASLDQQILGILCSVIFCVCGAVWGFALKLKLGYTQDRDGL